MSILIHWIVIYPVDSVIQSLNNWDLEAMRFYAGKENGRKKKMEKKMAGLPTDRAEIKPPFNVD